jgi:hypothetical protein
MAIPYNVGGTERNIRIGAGVVLIVLSFLAFSGIVAFLAFVIGAVALVTGIIRYCPVNALIDRNTSET